MGGRVVGMVDDDASQRHERFRRALLAAGESGLSLADPDAVLEQAAAELARRLVVATGACPIETLARIRRHWGLVSE